MRFWFKLELGGPKELKDNFALSSLVPTKTRSLYTEAKTCCEAGAYRASVVMLRAAVERTLTDKSLNELSNLAGLHNTCHTLVHATENQHNPNHKIVPLGV